MLKTIKQLERLSGGDVTDKPLLNDKQVAQMLGVSVATVRRWRIFNTGPKYLKIGASVRYTTESLDAYVASRPTGGGVA